MFFLFYYERIFYYTKSYDIDERIFLLDIKNFLLKFKKFIRAALFLLSYLHSFSFSSTYIQIRFYKVDHKMPFHQDL